MKTGLYEGTPYDFDSAPGGTTTTGVYSALPAPPPYSGYQRFESLFTAPFLQFGHSSCREQDPQARLEKRPFCHQIVFPRSGCFVCHQGRRELVGEPGQVFFFAPHEPYTVSHPGGSDDCTWFAMHEMALRDALEVHAPHLAQLDPLPFPVSCLTVDTRTFQFAVLAEKLARRGQSQDPFLIQELVLNVLDATLAAAAAVGSRPRAESPTGRAHEEIVDAVRRLLVLNYREPIDLHRAAVAVHCSPFHLCRIFRARTGLTLHRYLVKLRLRAALTDVLDPHVSLAELALRVGFSSHSHFTTAFTREFGLPPSLLRRDSNRATLDEIANFLKAIPEIASLQ